MASYALAGLPNATEPFDALKLAHDPRGIRPKELGDFRPVTGFGLYNLNPGDPHAYPGRTAPRFDNE